MNKGTLYIVLLGNVSNWDLTNIFLLSELNAYKQVNTIFHHGRQLNHPHHMGQVWTDLCLACFLSSNCLINMPTLQCVGKVWEALGFGGGSVSVRLDAETPKTRQLVSNRG